MIEAPAERPKPSLLSPPILLATWFGSGLLPGMPGTWGSLAALPFAWAIHLYWGPAALFGAALAVFAVGVWASDIYARAAGTEDPGAVVIDEVAGQWLTLALAAPLDPLYYALGFLFFRVADIVKPWPVSWAERRFAGGLGIMLDDIFAAFYAAVALVALGYALGRF
ncbi:MAG: phosphatidylglycerophosphatase A [Rhodospirillaceae bacterium]